MKLRIRTKLILFSCMIALLVGGGISLYSMYLGRERAMRSFERDSRDIAALVGDTVFNGLYFINVNSLRLNLQSARINPDVAYAYVTDAYGVVLSDGTDENPRRDEKLADPFSLRALEAESWITQFDDAILKVGGPVLGPDGERVGILQLGFSLGSTRQVVRDGIQTSLVVTAICFILGALLAIILSSNFTRPIHALVRASKEIGRGRLQTRLSMNRSDELGDLASSLNEMAVALDRANRRQADFTAMIAHDLRSPLNTVIGAAGMIEDGLLGDVNEAQKKWLQKIAATSNGLVDLVSDFLDVSKIEAGHVELRRDDIDLRPLLQKCIENYLPLARKKSITLRDGTAPRLPSISADPRRLEQVVGNLLSNALKFTREGGEIEVGAKEGAGGTVEVSVKDTGVGISPAELPAIFEKYRQTSSGIDSKHKGTGLGLVICKMIIEAHGGRIWADSQEGRGATFCFSLPAS